MTNIELLHNRLTDAHSAVKRGNFADAQQAILDSLTLCERANKELEQLEYAVDVCRSVGIEIIDDMPHKIISKQAD